MMFRKFLLSILIVTIILLTSGCGIGLPTGTRTEIPETLYGFSFSPKDPSDILPFFEEVDKAGNSVTQAGDWNDLSPASGGANTVTSLAQTYDLIPIVLVGYYNQGEGKMLRPLTEETKRKYQDLAIEFVKKYKPAYFGTGVEVNVMQEKSPADFEAFVAVFDETYDLIKEVSPDTQVFTVFQLEKMKGLDGGLFGGKNDTSKSDWELLDKFPKADLIGFTTYPNLIYKSPSEIPSDYYSEISKHTDKPIGFFESGWHTEAGPKGWESSEAEQAEFVKLFLEEMKELKPKIIIWSFLYDVSAPKPFDTTGLIRSDDSKRPAYDEWLKQAQEWSE